MRANKKPRKTKPTTTLIRMPEQLKAQLDAAAIRSGLSLNEVMVRWLNATNQMEIEMERHSYGIAKETIPHCGTWLIQEAIQIGLASNNIAEAEEERKQELRHRFSSEPTKSPRHK
jgi:hypothetical protein